MAKALTGLNMFPIIKVWDKSVREWYFALCPVLRVGPCFRTLKLMELKCTGGGQFMVAYLQHARNRQDSKGVGISQKRLRTCQETCFAKCRFIRQTIVTALYDKVCASKWRLPCEDRQTSIMFVQCWPASSTEDLMVKAPTIFNYVFVCAIS